MTDYDLFHHTIKYIDFLFKNKIINWDHRII